MFTGVVDVEAPARIVHGLLVDPSSWQSWNPLVEWAAVDGFFADGGTFTVQYEARDGLLEFSVLTVSPVGFVAEAPVGIDDCRLVHTVSVEPIYEDTCLLKFTIEALDANGNRHPESMELVGSLGDFEEAVNGLSHAAEVIQRVRTDTSNSEL